MGHGYAQKKTDGNHRQMVEMFRRLGASVQSIHTVGKGCPDLLVGYAGQNVVVEVKPHAGAKLTPDELDWHRAWRGNVRVLWLVDQVGPLLAEMERSACRGGCSPSD